MVLEAFSRSSRECSFFSLGRRLVLTSFAVRVMSSFLNGFVALESFAWSHFLTIKQTPLERKML
jgi:hypothetical protein